VLLYRAEDVALQRYFTGGTPPEAEIRDLVAVLRERPHDRAELRERSGFSPRKLTQLLTLLTEIDVIVVDSDGRLFSPATGPVPVEAARLALAEVERHQAVQRTRIDMMRQFAETRTCRGQALLAYFGDGLEAPCGHCDNCLNATDEAPPPVPVSKQSTVRAAEPPAVPGPSVPPDLTWAPPVGGIVRHRTWGAGTVLGYEGDRMTVLFDSVGYKTLSVGVVREKDLLVVVAE
jgi:ATP-dependent DNA helicase RecQ